MRPTLILALTLWPCCFSSHALAAGSGDPSAAEFFEKEIRPILAQKCQSCHGAKKTRGGLRLLSRDLILKGGDSGPVVVPSRPDQSLLLQAIEYQGDLKMLPKGKLSRAEIARLKRWIVLGAPWPRLVARSTA
jgi:hypothetical protein